jgi:hypothetical protein
MTATLTIEGKQLGRKQRLFPDRQVPYPPDWQHSGGRTTLRDLITRIVLDEVATFRQRQEERRLYRTLTAAQITQGASTGKIDPGGRDLDQVVDDDTAVAIALQAFEDGLYFVFIDGQQQKDLDAIVYVSPNSTVTFVRLVALAGG